MLITFSADVNINEFAYQCGPSIGTRFDEVLKGLKHSFNSFHRTIYKLLSFNI